MKLAPRRIAGIIVSTLFSGFAIGLAVLFLCYKMFVSALGFFVLSLLLIGTLMFKKKQQEVMIENG